MKATCCNKITYRHIFSHHSQKNCHSAFYTQKQYTSTISNPSFLLYDTKCYYLWLSVGNWV